MEILAVGGLAYLGAIINQHIIKDQETVDDKKEDKKERFAFFNKREYKNEGLNKIEKKYNKRVKEIKDLSFIPAKTKVIPSFYNQIPAVGEEYDEQKLPIPGKLDNTSGDNLYTLDDQFKFGEITKKEPVASGFELEIHQNWTPFQEQADMTYGIFDKSELKHNNMQHFYRRRDDVADNWGNGKMVDEINSNNNATKMELFTGSSKHYYPKEAPPPFFKPMKDVHFVNGAPNQTNKLVDRMVPGNKRAGEKPFQPTKVQPGLALGYNEESKIGFHDTYRAPQVNIDFQRVGNRMQKTNAGVVIPGMKGQKQPVDPNVAKRRPEKLFEQPFGTAGNGGVSKPANNPEQIVKDQMRQFSIELKNGGQLASGSLVGPFNADGIKKEPHKLQFGEVPAVGPNMQSINNNNLPSYYLLDNQRTETTYNYYDGPTSNKEMNKGTLFNTQPATSTQRQTTAETAQDGHAHGDVRLVHQYNTQPTNSNLRQTTAEPANDGIAYGDIRKGNQYNTQPSNSTLRQTTAETVQDGPAHGDIRQVHQYNIQPTNSTIRQTTTETAQDGPAYGDIRQVHQYNTQPTNSNLRQTTTETAQDGPAYGDIRQVHQYNIQPTNSNLRQTTAEPANDGMAYGDTRKGNQYNTQPANPNLRQTTAETANDGIAYGDTRKGHQYNTQPANPNLRQTTAEPANDGPMFGSVRKGNQFNTQSAKSTLRQVEADNIDSNPAKVNVPRSTAWNTQPANSTFRQETAETANDGPAGSNVPKTSLFNTQPANATHRQNTAETAQENPARHTVSKTNLFNTQPANPTIRQIVNYNDYNGGSHVLVEEPRSRSDANAMTTHSGREDTTVGRTFTYSGWNEGISLRTLGDQSSKEKDVNNNWTRVNPPSAGPRSNAMQDMTGFNNDKIKNNNLDDRIVYQLNRIKDFPNMGDRIETKVAEVLQNNELINNAFQKYGNKPTKLYPNVHNINK
jgi:hypothetical protein